MDKKQLGAFYTPGHTVDYILKQVHEVSNFNLESKILEPSGGDGIFVSHLLNNYQVNPKNVDVWDINYEVENTILKYGVNFQCRDALLGHNFSESLFFQGDGYYSHIIGNPPYLNKQSDYIKNNKHKLKNIYGDIGVYDTYAMFIYMGCKLLKQRGCIGFIVSDTFLTLGIHKNFRKFLLKNFSIKEITLCPKNLFEGATVSTCIIVIKNEKPQNNSKFKINDCRCCELGEYSGIISEYFQVETLGNPDYVFDINRNSKYINYCKNNDKMVDYLFGGLGMHTKDNEKYLAIINYNGVEYAKKKNLGKRININEIDGKNWLTYHKQGGNYKYYLPAEYAVKWDETSVSNYVIPKNINGLKDKQGFLISGVCSSLSARLTTPGSMRESNKAMCFFPKDINQYQCEYFLGLLNSSVYNKIIKALNHTNSIQIRDIYKLPMLHLSEDDKNILVETVKKIIENMKVNLNYDFSEEQNLIDSIVEKYF